MVQPLLLGSDFMRLMFEISAAFEPGKPYAGVEPPPSGRGHPSMRLISGEEQPELVEVEKFQEAEVVKSFYCLQICFNPFDNLQESRVKLLPLQSCSTSFTDSQKTFIPFSCSR